MLFNLFRDTKFHAIAGLVALTLIENAAILIGLSALVLLVACDM